MSEPKADMGLVLNRLKAQLSQMEVFSQSRASLMAAIGGREGTGRRNYDRECDYPTTVSLEQFVRSYDREGLGKRIVTVYPEESWKQAPLVFETEDQEETAFEEALDALVLRHNLWHNLRRVDELSGIGRFGILLLGLGDNQNLDQPVRMTEKPKTVTAKKEPTKNAEGTETGTSLELLYLRAFDERAVTVETRETDPRSKRFGKPVMYSVTFQDDSFTNQSSQGQTLPTSGTPQQAQQTLKVHWTRALHVADNRTRSEVYGDPRQQVVYNRLVDSKKVLGGGSEMFWKGGYPGLSIEAMPGVTEYEQDDESLKQQFLDYDNGLQRFLGLIGVSVKPLVVPVEDPTPQYEMLLTDVCIALGCPKRVFMGSERGELASSQDSKAWNSRLGRRRDEYLTPLVIRPFVDHLIAIGILPAPAEDYTVEWPDLNAITDDEKAGIALKMSQAIQAYLNAGGESLIPPRLFLTLVLKLTEEEAEAIADEMDDWAGGFQKPTQPGFDENGNPVDPSVDPAADPSVDPTADPAKAKKDEKALADQKAKEALAKKKGSK